MTSQTTVGVIGAGTIARTMHIPVLRAMSSVQLAWLADVDERRARYLASLNRIAPIALDGDLGILPPCDAILLAIPLWPRRRYFEHFLKMQTAVFAEKPLCIDSTEHEYLISRFDPWRLAVGYQRRHYATSRVLRGIIGSGVFGQLRKIVVREGGRVTRAADGGSYQDEPVAQGGGITKNLGCHSLDLALWLTQCKRPRLLSRHIKWDDRTDRGARASMILTDVASIPGNDCELDWGVSWLQSQSNTMEFVFGTTILRCAIAPDDKIELLDSKRRLVARLALGATDGALTSSQAFYLEWDSLLQAIRTRCECAISAASCLATARLMDELLAKG